MIENEEHCLATASIHDTEVSVTADFLVQNAQKSSWILAARTLGHSSIVRTMRSLAVLKLFRQAPQAACPCLLRHANPVFAYLDLKVEPSREDADILHMSEQH
jgi:hypothetical protein